MAEEWAQSQRDGWLCELYGKEDETGRRQLPQDSVQWQLVVALQKMLQGSLSPEQAASQVASLITSRREIEKPYSNLLGMYFRAAEQLSDVDLLQSLVHFIVALASLPDAINESSETLQVDMGGFDKSIEPGKKIELDGGKLWADLPMFGMNLTESCQGPEAYLHPISQAATAEAAKDKWRNINTYIALLTKSPGARQIPVLTGTVAIGLRAIASALEHSPSTRIGEHTALYSPAAKQWLFLAGHEIEEACRTETEKVEAGDLWREQESSSDICDAARLIFWRRRVGELDG